MSGIAMLLTPKSKDGWTKAGFPATINNAKESIKFFKRLVAIGFSHILHHRTDLPDECFKTHRIGTIDCSMLKAKSISEAANKLTTRLKSAMDALDKGFLRQLIIEIMQNEEQEVFETYTFNFSKVKLDGNTRNSPSFTLMQNKKNGMNHKKGQNKNVSIVESNDLIRDENCNSDGQYSVYRATKNLMQKLNAALQDLQPLPERCFMTVTIGYNEITPDDYHPDGFYAYPNERRKENLRSLAIGEVKSNFHEVDMSIAAKELAVAEKITNECVGGTVEELNESLVHSSDISSDGVAQEKEMPNNESMIPLQTGLDISTMEHSKDDGSHIDLSHGSNVAEVNTQGPRVENIQGLEVNLKSERGNNARKFCTLDSPVCVGNSMPKKRKAFPSSHGDSPNRRSIVEISNKMKDLKAGDIKDRGNSLNTSNCSTRSPKALNPPRREVSVVDTFAVEYFEHVQPKASKSQYVITI